jgi:hypothetical protein
MKWGALKQNEAYSFPQNINILGFLPILSVTVQGWNCLGLFIAHAHPMYDPTKILDSIYKLSFK